MLEWSLCHGGMRYVVVRGSQAPATGDDPPSGPSTTATHNHTATPRPPTPPLAPERGEVEMQEQTRPTAPSHTHPHTPHTHEGVWWCVGRRGQEYGSKEARRVLHPFTPHEGHCFHTSAGRLTTDALRCTTAIQGRPWPHGGQSGGGAQVPQAPEPCPTGPM